MQTLAHKVIVQSGRSCQFYNESGRSNDKRELGWGFD